MKNRRWIPAVVCCLAFLLCCVPFAMLGAAEESTTYGYARLLQQGEFPEQRLSVPKYLSGDSFSPATPEGILCAGLAQGASEISLAGTYLTVNDLESTLEVIVNKHPELFFFSGVFGCRVLGGRVMAVTPEYNLFGQDRISAQTIYEEKLSEIVDQIDPDLSELEKILWVHEYFAAHFSYDLNYQNYSAYRLFTTKTGVCQAYSLGVIAVLNRLEIPVGAVASREMNHVWNAVKIEGCWYHLDVTWDDPTPDRVGMVSHNNFLRGDDGIAATGHYGWYGIGTTYAFGNDTDYSFLRSGDCPYVCLNGKWYTIQKKTNEYTLSGGVLDAMQTVMTLDGSWPVWDNSNYHWGGYFSGLAVCGDTLIYNDSTHIYSLNPVSGVSSRTTLETVDASTGYIYGFSMDRLTVSYILAGQKMNDTTLTIYDTKTLLLPAARGDLNSDSQINYRDAVYLSRVLAGWELTYTVSCADVNADGAVNLKDLASLLRRIENS